jgi:hypothetical protein
MKKSAMGMGMVLAAYCLVAFNLVYGQATNPGSKVLLNQNRGTLMAPPVATASCKVTTLELVIKTGNDDLRGGQDNLNVEIHYVGGRMQTAKNVNNGANWGNNSVHTVVIPLSQAVQPMDIQELRLVHLAQGSFTPPRSPLAVVQPEPQLIQGIKSEDNWDMAEFQAVASSLNAPQNSPAARVIPIAAFGFHRFTGSVPDLLIPANRDIRCPVAGQVKQLQFRFKTGNDDLRGGNDNVGINIQFTDGSQQGVPNVNQGQRWVEGSMHSVEVLLDRSVTLDQIRAVTLTTTFTGGSGGDNWNMDSVDIMALVDGVMHPVTTAGFHRFSSDWTGPKAKSITIALK